MENRMTDHGMVNWVDIVTTDKPATIEFYKNVFGYTTEDMPHGEGKTYTILVTPAGARIGGIMEGDGTEKFQSKIYFTVNNAQESEQQIKELGGSVLMQATDMDDMGIFGIYKDDAGAVFGITQPSEKNKQSFNADLDKGGYAPGTISWFDVLASDVKKATSFYSKVFNYTPEGSPDEYIMFLSKHAKNSGFGGVFPMPEDAKKQLSDRHIKPYITVENVEETNKRIVENGGKIIIERFDLPEESGYFSAALDNAHNMISPIYYAK